MVEIFHSPKEDIKKCLKRWDKGCNISLGIRSNIKQLGHNRYFTLEYFPVLESGDFLRVE